MRLHLSRLESRETPATLPPNFSEAVIGEGIQSAAGFTLAPNGDAWVLEQTGTVKRFRPGTSAADVVFSLTVDSTGERGLLGLAFDPNYATNKFIYVYHTVPSAGVGVAAFNRVSRFTVDDANPIDYAVNLSTQQVLLNLDPLTAATNHNGGDLAFSTDGKLYIGVGENANGTNSQTLANRHGKVLRINPDGTIPTDNPITFDGVLGSPTGANRAIYAIGFRNPYRLAVQPGSGRIFVNDVGAGAFEEVNDLRAGANYGWPQSEGFQPPSRFGVTYPVYAYAHGNGPLQGNAITGGAFYTPAVATFPPEYRGDYFFADFIAGRIFVRDDATGNVTTFAESAGLPVDLAVADDGRLIYLSRQSGQLMAVTYTPSLQPAVGLSAAGSGPSTAAQVVVRNADGTTRFTLTPYIGFNGGATVAVGDVNADGSDDIITGAAAGGGPHVKVFDGRTGTEIGSFFAYDARFAGGVSVAAGDIDNNGSAEIITGAGAGGGPHVKVFSMSGAELQSFFAYAPAFAGGVSVAAGDLDGDGRAEIITGAGPGGGPHVKAFRATDLLEVRSFYAFDPAFSGGVNVAAGDTDGDRRADIIAAPAIGGNSVISVVRTTETVNVAAFDPRFQGGVRVGFSNGILWVGAGPGGGPHVRGFASLSLTEVRSFYAFDPTFAGGVFVG